MSIVGLTRLAYIPRDGYQRRTGGLALRTVLLINSMREGLQAVSGKTRQDFLAADDLAMLTKSACTDLPSALIRSGLGAS